MNEQTMVEIGILEELYSIIGAELIKTESAPIRKKLITQRSTIKVALRVLENEERKDLVTVFQGIYDTLGEELIHVDTTTQSREKIVIQRNVIRAILLVVSDTVNSAENKRKLATKVLFG